MNKSLQGGVGVAWRGLKTIAYVPEGGGAWRAKTLRDDSGASKEMGMEMEKRAR